MQKSIGFPCSRMVSSNGDNFSVMCTGKLVRVTDFHALCDNTQCRYYYLCSCGKEKGQHYDHMALKRDIERFKLSLLKAKGSRIRS